MLVNISILRSIAEQLFDHLEELELSSVELTDDYYWNISEDERYDVENQPKDLSIGQLTEDWEFLQRIGRDDDYTVAYGLVWLGKILQAIGEKVIR